MFLSVSVDSACLSPTHLPVPITSSSSVDSLCSKLSLSITHSFFRCRGLKRTCCFANLSHHEMDSAPLSDCLHRLSPGPFLLSNSVVVVSVLFFTVSVFFWFRAVLNQAGHSSALQRTPFPIVSCISPPLLWSAVVSRSVSITLSLRFMTT